MMNALSKRQITAILLILSVVAFLVAASFFTARTIWKWPSAQTDLHMRWERVLAVTACLIMVLGFVLLEGLLREAGDRVIARLAVAIMLISAAVVLAFLAQAAFGAALLRTGLVARWAGWATILWNIGLLVVMPIASPRDIYFPWLHYVAPLLIGIALLARS